MESVALWAETYYVRTAGPLVQRHYVLPALRARRPLEVAQAEVRDPVGAAHAILPVGLIVAAAVALLADAAGHAAGVLDALLVRPADPVEARVWRAEGKKRGINSLLADVICVCPLKII